MKPISHFKAQLTLYNIFEYYSKHAYYIKRNKIKA
jgi:hypothetical protein